MANRVAVFGAGGHAKVVVDALLRLGHEVVFVVDDAQASRGRKILGIEVVGGRDALMDRRAHVAGCVVAIGDNSARVRVAGWLRDHGLALLTVVHPQATIGRGVDLGPGSVVFAGCVINADTAIAENVIVNTGATIDHDCRIGSGAHIAPGCHLCGNVTVGERSLLGVGVAVVPGVAIGADVVVGAGSTVLADVPDGVQVAGTPAR